MPHPSAALHQLYLLLVHLQNAAIGIGITIVTHHKTVRQGGNLIVVANTGHGPPLRHNVFKIFQGEINLLVGKRMGIFLLDPCNLTGQTPVHVIRSQFVEIPEGVL